MVMIIDFFATRASTFILCLTDCQLYNRLIAPLNTHIRVRQNATSFKIQEMKSQSITITKHV